MSTEDQSDELRELRELIKSDELRELRELITSAGWHRFTEMVDQQYGPEATLRRVEEKIAGVAMGNQDGVNDMTQHVLSAAKAARSAVLLPKERIAALSGQHTIKKPFAAWRRA